MLILLYDVAEKVTPRCSGRGGWTLRRRGEPGQRCRLPTAEKLLLQRRRMDGRTSWPGGKVAAAWSSLLLSESAVEAEVLLGCRTLQVSEEPHCSCERTALASAVYRCTAGSGVVPSALALRAGVHMALVRARRWRAQDAGLVGLRRMLVVTGAVVVSAGPTPWW